ncbi:MAG TPA: diadenylate cyclase CdaA [Thermoanaerobaculia bacterium]|nr:diadenylate cyclase CdaA [Thermoanaerobaculia bacterium]
MTQMFGRLGRLEFGWRDAIDILLVALVIYGVIRLIQGTRAMQMSIGLATLGLTFVVARALQFVGLEMITGQILFYTPFAIIVLFQHEIRRALASMGRGWMDVIRNRTDEPQFDAVVAASKELARRRVGALIAIERTQSLRMYIETGKPLEALISAELLQNIFTPSAPLHDGAVIIQGGRIAAAGTFLPLSASTDLPEHFGTRHRAALGLSEESDAFIVVVSEENGAISAAFDGRLHENLKPAELAHLLRFHLKPNGRERFRATA